MKYLLSTGSEADCYSGFEGILQQFLMFFPHEEGVGWEMFDAAGGDHCQTFSCICYTVCKSTWTTLGGVKNLNFILSFFKTLVRPQILVNQKYMVITEWQQGEWDLQFESGINNCVGLRKSLHSCNLSIHV